ncbi:hypothetical protein CVD27_27045 [Neobacillus cucumis]|uniref:Glycosyl hydrolase n=1 Tax=Neobacillus cucumis TaxID=1740721 RepID=A0A2N5H6I8_9BACI|nr:hypothetical protein CVD27_27045 [Neobacillus cucumis]
MPNKAPLKETPFLALPLGSIEPDGWLRDQLLLQAEGLTGKLDEFWEDVGPGSGWLGGSGESWERGPYYLDGLLPLAYLLKNDQLIQKVKPWVEWTLGSQRGDGNFGPENVPDWWCRMIMLKVLIMHQEVTNDERVIPFLSRYFQYQLEELKKRPLTDWGQARGGENILCAQWLYNRTEDSYLLELIHLLHEQTLDWTEIFNDFPFWRYQTEFDHRIHVVNVAMGIKEPALYFLISGEAKHQFAARNGIESLMTHHGQMHGMWSGDEWLAGSHPSQGTELCSVVEYMFSLEQLVRILGEGMYADLLERVTFNALPAAISPDWHGHQYDQQVNQVACTLAKRNWTLNGDDSNLFGLEPNFGCCTANMHQGWPKYAMNLWMATVDNGLAAISYAPCTIQAKVANGVDAKVKVLSQYPFRDTISIDLQVSKNAYFSVKLRIPTWCKEPRLLINGQEMTIPCESGFITIERHWETNQTIELTLPMEVKMEKRANYAVGVTRGPLVYVLPISERWEKLRGVEPFADFEIYPETVWNYGLVVDSSNPEASFQVQESKVSKQPFLAKDAPVKLVGTGKRVPHWKMEKNSAGTIPIGPVFSDQLEETITLVPYGSARLRIGEFPLIQSEMAGERK